MRPTETALRNEGEWREMAVWRAAIPDYGYVKYYYVRRMKQVLVLDGLRTVTARPAVASGWERVRKLDDES
jgi:hypothetical protein